MEPQLEPQEDTKVEEKKLPWPISLLFDNQIAIWKYVIRTGLISLIPSLVIVMILGLTGIITEETAPKFEGPAIILFIGLIVIAPPLETLLMAVGLRLLSFITKRPVRLAIFSAFIWAVVHSLEAPVWGLGVIWPFFVFSCCYLSWRRHSWWRAIFVTTCVHAFQNILPAIAVIATL